MAPVLWVIAVLGNLTVVHRMIFTYQEAKRLEDAQLSLEDAKLNRSARTATKV
jgi:CDP-diacylglycerol--glycerol-3-phosphate 3-phosphatidyltransferase